MNIGRHSIVTLAIVVVLSGCESDSSVPQKPEPPVRIHVNQVGYHAAAPKRAVISARNPLERFTLTRISDSEVVFEDALTEVDFSAWEGGPHYYVADFSDVDALGRYRIDAGEGSCVPFLIGSATLLEETLDGVLSYFKHSRADDPAVWAADARVPFYGGVGYADVRGGWYDASGDISKYLSHLSYANFLNPQQIPLTAWSLAWVSDEGTVLSDEQRSAAQSEALWGADYLLRVLDPEGYFYINVFDGWTGNVSDREICSFSGPFGTKTYNWQAAFREGGGMSIAALARVSAWGKAGAFSAGQYLEGAERGFAHLQANSERYADDGASNIIDDYAALLAASELYATTQDDGYLSAARARATSLIGRLHETGYFIADNGSRPFWHASDAGLPVVALARYIDVEPSSEPRDAALGAIASHLDYLVAVSSEVANPYGYARQHFVSGGKLISGFFMPHDNESGYWWQGENARLASLAAASLIGGRKLEDPSSGALGVSEALAAYATDQLNWILGENPFDICFLNGAGHTNPPAYCGSKPQHGTLAGGISNGITGTSADGSGIEWMETSSGCSGNWRWVEQWLPHSTWYLVAIVALTQTH